MKRYTCKTHVTASPDALYAALSDLRRWPEWDADIADIEHDGSEPRTGTRFVLKPSGGPKTTLVVEAAERPHRFTDLSLLPLGRMRTTHEFIGEANGRTEVRVTIETFGLLGWLWDRLIARKQAAGAETQAQSLAAFAEKNSVN